VTSFEITKIRVDESHRPLDEATLEALVDSIRELGLLHPIVVEADGGNVVLVAGRHRLEACRRLGHRAIDAVNIYAMILDDDPSEAECLRPIVEIEENLCRLNVKDRKAATKRLLQAKRALKSYREKRAAAKASEQAQAEPQVEIIETPCPETRGRPTKKSRKTREFPAASKGRPRNAAKDEVAKTIGVTRRTVDRALQEEPEAPEEPSLPKRSAPKPPKANPTTSPPKSRLIVETCQQSWLLLHPKERENFRMAYKMMTREERAAFWAWVAA